MLPGFQRCREAQLFQPPIAVVVVTKLQHSLSHLVKVLEDFAIDHLLFERPVEPLDNPIGLRFLNKPEAGFDPQPTNLALKVLGTVSPYNSCHSDQREESALRCRDSSLWSE